MDEETNETQRYFLEVGQTVVEVVDGQTGQAVESFAGPDRLLAATGRLAQLNQAESVEPEDWAEEVTPSAFLSETLPAYARVQRRGALLAELDEIERIALEHVRSHSEILSRALRLRERILAEPQGASVKPLSATLSAQKAEEVPVTTTPDAVQALTDAQSPDLPAWLVADIEASQAAHRRLSKPGPY